MKKAAITILVLLAIILIAVRINNRETEKDFLVSQLAEVEALFDHRKTANLSVSQANVEWHLDHTLKTINRISSALIASDPERYESKFNMQRVFVHTTGHIPRGAAQSPANVRPPEQIELDSLHAQLELARTNLSLIHKLTEKAYFEHPVFDHLDRDQTRRFLEVHTNHHLKIIEDIMAK